MSRVWLVIAMAVSLWPAAWLLVSIATDSANDPAASTRTAPNGQSAAKNAPSGGTDDTGVPEEADLDSYMALRDRMDALLKELDRSDVMRGVGNPGLSGRAAGLASDYALWDEGNGGLDPDLQRLARGDRQIALRASALAAAPSQAALDRFNAAIREFNSTLLDVQG